MIDYGTFRFAAPPRTGCTWFLKACSMARLGEGLKSHVHSPSPPRTVGLTVSLIRHPHDWLCSYFYALQGGHMGIPAVDDLSFMAKDSVDFAGFMRRYIKRCSGKVSLMFDSYNADTVMKTEELKWSSLEFFASLNVKKNLLDEIKRLPPQNVGKNMPIKTDTKLRERVCEAESSFCNRYDYDISW